MPVYNGEKYLREAIESILNQTAGCFEFIIVNDGSTDSSPLIIEEYKRNDNRIKVVTQKNQGLIASLNTAIGEARGKYIARMDADDISLPKRFEKQVDLCEKYGLDLCGCHFNVIDELSRSISSVLTLTDSRFFGVALIRSVPFAHGSVLFNREFYLKNKLSYGNTKYPKAEDYALWCQFYVHNARFGNVDDFLFNYRDVSGSLSSNKYNLIHASKISSVFMLENECKILCEIDKIDFISKSDSYRVLLKNIAYFGISRLNNMFFKKITILRKLSMYVILRALISKSLVFIRAL